MLYFVKVSGRTLISISTSPTAEQAPPPPGPKPSLAFGKLIKKYRRYFPLHCDPLLLRSLAVADGAVTMK
ncbi:hypothetical protein EPI10_000538 [Gossypium australe]|uniref:Uncharacterized protein n=1 Tax=Gossypium australe TaxID=47621 RepID=A0A5B6V895_9ROSI|nr:hypothetical protein EPI10_000538 [Gossypium australe]